MANIIVGKFGKSVSFNFNKWGMIGGDSESAIFIASLAQLYPHDNFYIVSIIFQNNQILSGVLGEFNSNLYELEKLTETKLYFRGNSIIIKNSNGKNKIFL